MTRDHTRPRPRAGVAPLLGTALLLALVAGACGASSSPSGSPASGAASSPSASAPTAAASGSAGATTPADRLAAAFAAMSAGYTYTATVAVGGNPVSTATGRSVGGSSEFVLTTGGTSVTYRAIPPKAWVQQPGKGWVEVSGKVPPGSPLAALTAPTSTSVVSDAPGALVVDAVYPASALGLAGSAPVTVRLTAAADGTLTAAFGTTVGQDPATSTSVFTPGSGLAPIAAPG